MPVVELVTGDICYAFEHFYLGLSIGIIHSVQKAIPGVIHLWDLVIGAVGRDVSGRDKRLVFAKNTVLRVDGSQRVAISSVENIVV